MSRKSRKHVQPPPQKRQANTNTSKPSMGGYSSSSQTWPDFNGQGSFSPGNPIMPITDITPTGPRIFPYQIGYNLASGPRVTEQNSFATLRSYAGQYEVIKLCEQVWFDGMRSLEPMVVPRPDLLDEGQDDSQYRADARKYEEWFADLGGFMPIHDAVCAAIKDQLEIDAVAWYPRRTRGGGIYALELLDGSTIKPLLDERGRLPEPPVPAYEQYVYGLPVGLYTTEDIIYLKETHRTESTYGEARAEKFLLRVQQAIRKEQRDLARLTAGNLPPGIVEVPGDAANWTPDDLLAYQKMWNARYAGNDVERSQAKVALPGTKYSKIDEDPIDMTTDRYLMNIGVGIFGVTLSDISFVEDVNRANGKVQLSVTARRTMRPTALRYAGMFTRIISTFFRDPRFIFTWKGLEEAEDFNAMATAHIGLVGAQIESPSDAAKALKLPVQVEVPPYVITPNQGIVTLDQIKHMSDLAVQQAEATITQAQVAAKNAEQAQQQRQQPTDDTATSTTQDNPDDPTQPPVQGGDADSEDEDIEDEAGDDEGIAVERAAANRPAVVEQHTGMMLAFLLDPATAQQLAIPGGEPPSDLHVTLAYLGDMEDDEPTDGTLRPDTSPFKIREAITSIASEAKPLAGVVGGVGRFFPAETDTTPVIALVDVPGLAEFRTKLVQAVGAANYTVVDNHGYTPHITLAYVDAEAPMPVKSVPPLPLVFDTVCLAVGEERYSFRLGTDTCPDYWAAKEAPHRPPFVAAADRGGLPARSNSDWRRPW